MIKINIPFQGETKILIGEIYVSCNISFRPHYPLDPKDLGANIAINDFNDRLSSWAYRFVGEISHKLSEDLIKVEKAQEEVKP